MKGTRVGEETRPHDGLIQLWRHFLDIIRDDMTECFGKVANTRVNQDIDLFRRHYVACPVLLMMTFPLFATPIIHEQSLKLERGIQIYTKWWKKKSENKRALNLRKKTSRTTGMLFEAARLPRKPMKS